MTDPAAMAIVLRHQPTVRLVLAWGDDRDVVEDARVSVTAPGKLRAVRREDRTLSRRDTELIREFLTRGHASTLRGCGMKLEFEVPIFLQREIRTHWVGMGGIWNENDWLGFNDQSGRYRVYRPIFWAPQPERPLLETDNFEPMTPTFRHAAEHDYEETLSTLRVAYQVAWDTYQELLDRGVAREVARAAIPEGIYVSGRITANLNAWLGFCAMRIDDPGNLFPTTPQREIQDLARAVEVLIAERWPVVHAAWVQAGRRRP